MTRRRDNVWKITRRYGVSKSDLALVNGSPLRLRKGRSLYIPRFEKPEMGEKSNLIKTANLRKHVTKQKHLSKINIEKTATHTVKKGETLWSIAAKYDMDVKMLKHINRLKTDRIESGKRLSLASYVRKYPQRSTKRYHRVVRGDTLSKIAEKYGKSVRTLRKMNHLKNNRIIKGMRLRVAFSGLTSNRNLPAFT